MEKTLTHFKTLDLTPKIPTTFNVSERFYSLQCEGATSGVPSYFIRLQSCNLCCGGPMGQLLKEGKATWWCDTEPVWRKGTKQSFDEIINDWKEEGIYDRIINGLIHIIWTGGEPTLPRHVRAIFAWNDYINELEPGNRIYNEIETNGTLCPMEGFYHDKTGEFNSPHKKRYIIDQINCSPKLSNTGESADIRINEPSIRQIQRHNNHWFKFVISNEEDIDEIKETYLKPFDIDITRVIIMPGVSERKHLAERTRFLFEMSKKYGYRAVTRSHILAWDQVTGV